MNTKKYLYPLTRSVLHKKDINAAIKVVKSKKITMGNKTREIERYFSKKITKIITDINRIQTLLIGPMFMYYK